MKEEARTKKDLLKELKSLQKKVNRLEKASRKLSSSQAPEIRVHADELIHQSEARSNRAELVSKSGNWELHLDSQIMFYSEGAKRIYGVSNDHKDYNTIKNNPLPEYRPLLDSALKNLVENNQPYNLEFKIKTADTGEIKDIHSIAEYDKERKIIFGVIQDITSQKHTEDILRESEERYRLLYENSPLGIYRTTPNGQILLANPALLKMLGYSSFLEIAERNLGKTGFEPLYERKQFIELVEATGEVKGLESAWTCNNGSIVYVRENTRAIRDSDGKTLYYDGIVEDITERKLSEFKLMESESRYRELFEAESDAVLFVDNETGSILDANHAAAALFGYEQSELLSMTNAGVSNEKGETNRILNMLLTGNNQVFSIPLRILRKKDGAIFPAEITGRSFIRAGRSVHIAAIRDITERRRAENIIIESERRFKEMANLLPMAIYEADLNGIITFVNETALTTFGYSPDDISSGIHIVDSIYEKDKPEALENMHKVLGGLHPSKNEYGMVRKDGSTFPALVFTAPIFRDGRTIGLRGTIVNITQQKLAENELRKLSEAVAQSPASIVITDPEGKIEYVNKSFEETTGYSLSEVIGRSPKILKSGYTKKEEYKILWDTIISGKTWHGEFFNKKKNGELFWEDAFISSVKDNVGNIINYLSVQQDITGKKKMTEELISAKNQAERSDRLKTEFLAQMSHEIRTPMNVTINCANVIKELLYDKIDDQAQRYFEGIELAGNRLVRTVDLILNVSEMQVGAYSPDFENVNLMKDILNNLRTEFEGYANQKGIEFIVQSSLSIPDIYCDLYSVNQIFVNLIDNAIKYTKKGKVEIMVERDIKEHVKVIVSDTGIGMSEEFLMRMFEPFMQEESGYSRRYEGNGLGLALVKKYCDLNEAAIDVESEKGKGSKFIVTFLKTENKPDMGFDI
jgi:PAS domain S-box-containing protein